MVQINHASMSHMHKDAEGPPKEVPVHTVMPPEDEAAFTAQMEKTESAFASQIPLNMPEIAKDPGPILEKESKRREVFNKLVLLKEDHYNEVTIGGLAFKLKLLNSDDNEFVMEAVKEQPGDRLANLSRLVLAAAVTEVNGIRFEEFFTGPASIQSPIMRRHYEIKQYQPPVINALQRAYSDFQASVEGEYTHDFLGK